MHQAHVFRALRLFSGQHSAVYTDLCKPFNPQQQKISRPQRCHHEYNTHCLGTISSRQPTRDFSSSTTLLLNRTFPLRQGQQQPQEQQKQDPIEESKSVSDSPPPQKFFEATGEQPHYDTSKHMDMPKDFGTNQFMHIDEQLRNRLRQLLWQFRAPVRYAVAYGSGVFSQGKSVSDQKPMIDLLFGVTFTQHWHSLNLSQHRDHYSSLGSLGSAVITYVQDNIGAGVYFNPYVEMNGLMIKYGVVNVDTLCNDLEHWDTLYLAGRLHKPVKILRDDSRVRMANQMNILNAVRVALLLLPENFTEHQLYTTIAGISYMGDPRMSLFTENPHKVSNIVENQQINFRRLYLPLVDILPNVTQKSAGPAGPPKDTLLIQDMDPVRRGNMVRRLPRHFRDKLYFQYQRKWSIPALEFQKLMSSKSEDQAAGMKGGEFEQRIAKDLSGIQAQVSSVIKVTISWPSTTQSAKGLLTSGVFKSWRYTIEKWKKWRSAKKSKPTS